MGCEVLEMLKAQGVKLSSCLCEVHDNLEVETDEIYYYVGAVYKYKAKNKK